MTQQKSEKEASRGRPLSNAMRKLLRVFAAGGSGGGAQTKRGTRRSKAKVSGFRARNSTPGGREVLKRRRKKGRKNLCPARAPTHANGAKRW